MERMFLPPSTRLLKDRIAGLPPQRTGRKLALSPAKIGMAPIISACHRPSIQHVSPLDLTVASEKRPVNPRPIRSRKKTGESRLPKFAVAAAAGGAAFLFPLIAQAGGAGLISAVNILAFGPIGLAIGGIGIFVTAKYLITKFKELKASNYQSRKSTLSVANPTPRKLFMTMILPAWSVIMGVGTFMAFAPALSNAITWGAFGALFVYTAANTTTGIIRDVARHVKYKKKGIQRNLKNPHPFAQIITTFFGNTGWLANIVFMSHLSKIYATQAWSAFLSLPHSIATANLPGLGLIGAAGAGLSLLYYLAIGRRNAAVANPLENNDKFIVKFAREVFRAAKSMAIWSALGILITLLSPGVAATNLLVLAMTLGFAHSFIHSTRSQESGLRQKDKIFPILDLQSLHETVRNAAVATFRTVFKPSVAMIDPMISSFVMVLLTEGAHWILNAISGCFNTN